MRFSDNGYYIERYIKCDNCGVLIYQEAEAVNEEDRIYCTEWCQEWARLRAEGAAERVLPLPRGAD